MDLNLQIKPRGDASVVASYTCPCGCNPRLSYERDQQHATDGCCCGNQFAVGSAAGSLEPVEGFVKEVQGFDAPWGERVQAAWTIGPSTDPNAGPEDAHGHGHDHAHDDGQAAAADAPATDPVCGMSVERDGARAKGLHSRHNDTDYFFCGKGCKLEFDEDPARYLDPTYVPSM